MKTISHLFILIAFSLFLTGNSCSKTDSKPNAKFPTVFIKNLEITMASKESDSVKYQRLKKVFEEHEISIDDYKNFFKTYAEENPQKSLPLLKKVEKAIINEIKTEAEKNKKSLKEKRKPDKQNKQKSINNER